jgi:hypothetical protein
VAADERAAEVDAFQVVFFGLQVGDLADVITVKELAMLDFGSCGFLFSGSLGGLTLWRIADSVKCLRVRTYAHRQ